MEWGEFCDPGGTLTRDTQNRNLMLYTTELRGLNLHIALKMVYYLAKQVITSITTKYSMITIGVCQLPEILVSLYQSLGIFSHISEMHIVVSQAVTDKQATM